MTFFSLIIIIGIIAMIVSAHRFGQRKQREGVWDANGPLEPLRGRAAVPEALELFDGGTRRAWESEHGTEGDIVPEDDAEGEPPTERPPI